MEPGYVCIIFPRGKPWISKTVKPGFFIFPDHWKGHPKHTRRPGEIKKRFFKNPKKKTKQRENKRSNWWDNKN